MKDSYGMNDKLDRKESHMDSMKSKPSGGGIYRNEVEKPEIAAMGNEGPGMGAEPGFGCMDFKGQADPIALGQAAAQGLKADEARMRSQYKDYHWD